MKDKKRQTSIFFQKALNQFFTEKKNEWKLPFISVTNVIVSPDNQVAKVYLSVFDPLNSSQKFEHNFIEKINTVGYKIKSHLVKKIGKNMRKFPDFTFYFDDSYKVAKDIEETLKLIQKEKK